MHTLVGMLTQWSALLWLAVCTVHDEPLALQSKYFPIGEKKESPNIDIHQPDGTISKKS
jgi:hypothetical protein